MTKNWIAINVVLLLLSGFLGWRLYTTALRFQAQNDVAKIQPARDPKQRITLEPGMPAVKQPAQYTVADFATVPAQNVFSETRAKEETVAAATAPPEVPPLTVRPILVGVSLSGDQKLASVLDPTAGGSAHRSQTRRLGDTYQGYTITDISRDQMVLERGNRREVIPMFDASKHPPQGTAAQSGKTPIMQTRVIAFGGGGGSSVAQPVSAGARPAAAAASSSAAAGQATPATGPGRNVPQAQQGRQMPAASQQSQPGASPADAQRGRVIRTPFGDVTVRPDP